MDLISLMALISTLLGKKSSGFLYVGFAFYILALLTALIVNRNLIPIFLGLMVLHFAINLPLRRLNKSR